MKYLGKVFAIVVTLGLIVAVLSGFLARGNWQMSVLAKVVE